MMRYGVVKASTLAATGRWDAEYNLTVADWLREQGLAETPENVRKAMDAIKVRDTETHNRAKALRTEAARLEREARALDKAAGLTYKSRDR